MSETPKVISQIIIAEPKYVPAQDHKSVYVNGTRMAMSPWDLRIICSTAKDLGGEVIHEDQVTIVMSPQHAKVVLKNWIATLNAYENLFGPIPDLGPMLADAKKNKGDAKEQPNADARPTKKTPRKKVIP